MRRARLSRFHLLTVATVLVCVVAPHWVIAGVAVLGYGTLVGLGVAFARLQMFGPVLWRVPTSEPVVALTFDDGPDPAVTPALLELLQRHGAPATFFVLGQRVSDHPALARQTTEAGHLLGNHSFGHSNFTNFFTTSRLRGELEQTQAVIARHTGQQPKYYRPPVGLTNPRVFRVAEALGLTVVGWTIRSLDTRLKQPDAIVRRIVRRLRPGAIIVLHDGGVPAGVLLPAVEQLLSELARRGYRVARLDRLMETK